MQYKSIFIYHLIFWVNLLFFSFSRCEVYNYDLTIVGRVKFSDSLSRLSIGLIDSLYPDLNINLVISSDQPDFSDLSYRVKQVVLDSLISKNIKPRAPIIFFTDMLWTVSQNLTESLPPGFIKIAYSMLESTQIPSQWVRILNSKFDAVVVPDDYYIDVYKKSGVHIPIFVIPCGLYLEPFLRRPLHYKPHKVFTFGCSAAFWPRKNCALLVKAFAEQFKNNPHVRLKLHGRQGEEYQYIKKIIHDFNITNIEVINKRLNYREYIEFMYSLDAYALISKGEGFSITPREALAMGIPTIISCNSAHITLAHSGFFRVIPCPFKEKAYYPLFQSYCGYEFNCNIAQVKEALLDVYTNYTSYLKTAHEGRSWVKKYQNKEVKRYYYNLFKPRNISLGQSNKITEHGISTNSINLYNKYKKLGFR